MSTPFVVPPGLRFTCSRCGDCCRGWNVMLGPGEEERLRALDWKGKEEDLVDAGCVVSTRLSGGGRPVRRLARRDDGACVYLGEDNLCRIHKHFGGETKPLMCQLFPFGFYPMGGKLAVEGSFACRALSQGSGAPLEERTGEWRRLLARGSEPREGRHVLSGQRDVHGSLVWEIEEQLVAFLDDTSLSFLDRVRCCLQFVRLATSGDPTLPAAPKLRQAIAVGLPRQIAGIPRGGGLDKTQRAVFFQWLFLALNPVPVNFDLLPPPAQAKEKKRRLLAGERFYCNQGSPWVDNREIGVSFAAVAAVDLDAYVGSPCTLLQSYFRAKVLGQRFLASGDRELPLVAAVPLFLLSFPMALWTARALAAADGRAAVGEEEVRRALRLLDRTLGQVSLAALPAKVAKAWRFVIEGTDLVVAATNELLSWVEPPQEATDEDDEAWRSYQRRRTSEEYGDDEW
jgi:lysine-N-methylase